MQPKFEAANCEDTINAIKKLVLNAKKDKAYVVIAEYMGYDGTHMCITDIIRKYKPRAYAVADRNDKSEAIQNKLHWRKVKTPVFKICGVNTAACVLATVQGLSKIMADANIQVIENACNSVGGKYFHDDGINQMKKLPNVTIH